MKTLFYLFVYVIVFESISPADLPVQRPSKSDMVGAWVGYENDSPAFFRLELGNNNKGRLITSFSGFNTGVVGIYKVNQWGLTNGILTLKLWKVTPSDVSVYCDIISYDYSRIKMVYGGSNISGFHTNTWECPVLLFNERRLSKDMSESAALSRRIGE